MFLSYLPAILFRRQWLSLSHVDDKADRSCDNAHNCDDRNDHNRDICEEVKKLRVCYHHRIYLILGSRISFRVRIVISDKSKVFFRTSLQAKNEALLTFPYAGMTLLIFSSCRVTIPRSVSKERESLIQCTCNVCCGKGFRSGSPLFSQVNSSCCHFFLIHQRILVNS